jgi:phosphopantothenoylcysteine synthetase/decarboxylase
VARILLGVSGGIAAYKALELARTAAGDRAIFARAGRATEESRKCVHSNV